MKKFFILNLLFFSLNSFISAQKFCSTTSVPLADWIKDMKARNVYPDFSKKFNNRATKYIPIHYHIVSKSNGLYGFPLYWVMKMHYELNKNYRKSNVGVQFYLDSISYIKSDQYYIIEDTSNKDVLVAKAYNTKMACNVYLVDDPKGACGYTQRPFPWGTPNSRTSIFVQASAQNYNCSNPGTITLTHEMGHWLDLPHTFFGWEGKSYGGTNQPIADNWERVARTGANSNCRTKGDGFCDTDPDYESNRWLCPSTKNYVDPLGVSFKLDPTNFMCYTSDICSVKFTPEQIVQMNNSFKAFNERSDFVTYVYPYPSGLLDSFKSFAPKTIKSTERIVKDQLKFIFENKPNAEKYLFTFFKGGNNYDPNFAVNPSVIILDTFIKSNEFTLPSSFVLSESIWYYWTVQPVTKTNEFDYGIPLQGFRVGALSLKANATSPKCAGSDGTVSFINNSGDNTIQYSIDGINYSNNSTLTGVKPGAKNAYFKKTNGSIYIIPVNVAEGNKVDGNVTVNVNNVVATGKNGVAPYSYVWSNGSTKSSLTLDSGSYELTIKDANGCVSDVIVVNVTNKISGGQNSISNLDINNSVRVYPTLVAFGEKVTIDNLTNKFCSIEVYSIDGKLVNSQTLQVNQGKVSFDWAQKTQGIYLLKVKNDTQEFNFKVQSK